MATTRDTVSTILDSAATLRALGLPEGNVLQADTLNSPEQKPFIVLRWGDESEGIAACTIRPFTLWVYDEFGDYNRATLIGHEAVRVLRAIEPTQTDSGWLTAIEGGLRGGDLADDGFDALVVPYTLVAVASGV